MTTDAKARAIAAVQARYQARPLKQDDLRRVGRELEIEQARLVRERYPHERITAAETGWYPGEGRAVVLIIVLIFVAGALAGAIAP